MHARIDDLASPDLDVWAEQPADPTDFFVFLQVFVAIDDATAPDVDDVELFKIFITTPRRLATMVAMEGPLDGRHLLIVDHWDWPTIRAAVAQRFETPEGKDRDDLVERLGRHGKWEFEDYVEPPVIDDPATAALLEQMFGPRAASTGDRTPAPPDEGRR